jgi:hypothetical protein
VPTRSKQARQFGKFLANREWREWDKVPTKSNKG